MKVAYEGQGKRRVGWKIWVLVALGAVFSLTALGVAAFLPPPSDLAVFDVLHKHGFITLAERDNIRFGSLSGEIVFEKEAITDEQYGALVHDFNALFIVMKSPSTWSYDWSFDGIDGFEPIRKVNLLDAHYDRGDQKGVRILRVVVRWEGRRDNLWDRFRKWAHI